MELNNGLSRNLPIKVFISQPMNGKTDEEIKTEREVAIRYIKLLYPRAICPVTYINNDPHGVVINAGIYYLAKSLEVMSACDAIYMADGWQDARGCVIERQVAIEYGLVEIPSGLLEKVNAK